MTDTERNQMEDANAQHELCERAREEAQDVRDGFKAPKAIRDAIWAGIEAQRGEWESDIEMARRMR